MFLNEGYFDSSKGKLLPYSFTMLNSNFFNFFLGLDYVSGAARRRGTKETCQQSDFVEEVWSTPPRKLRWTVKVGRKKVGRIPQGLRQDARRLGKSEGQ